MTLTSKWVKLHQQAKAGPVATNVPTVASYMTYWLAEVVEPNLAPLTYATYETLSRLYIVPGIGTKRLDGRLSVRDVQTWLNKAAKTCQCCAQGKDERRPPKNRKCCAVGRCCQDLPAARTVKGIRAVLRSALSQAEVEELVAKNVAALVKLPPIRNRKGKSWSSEEARAFLEASRDDDDYRYAAYVLVLVLGLRKGEVRGLTWEHINWDGWQKPCTTHGESSRALPRQPRQKPRHRQAAPTGTRPTATPKHQDRRVRRSPTAAGDLRRRTAASSPTTAGRTRESRHRAGRPRS